MPRRRLKGVYLSPTGRANDTNMMDVFVFGHEEQILVATRFDNLGKGASGAAVQSMNLMLGIEEYGRFALSGGGPPEQPPVPRARPRHRTT